MNIYIYVDLENMSMLKKIPRKDNFRYFIFVGANQSFNLKIEQSVRIKKIKSENIKKDYLDHKLVDFILRRMNVPNTVHYILSKDKGFDSWVFYINSQYRNTRVVRIEDIDSVK